MTWFRSKPAPQPSGRLTPAEAIIISRSGHTEHTWNQLAPAQRADIRWKLGLGGT